MKRRDFIRIIALSLASIPFRSYARDRKCVVLDDGGCSRKSIANLEKLVDVPVTVAVLPGSGYQRQTLNILRQYKNADVLLHQPMEPINMKERGLSIGQFGIYNSYSKKQAIETLERSIDALDYPIVGMNNHMGSLVTQNMGLMSTIAEYCAEHSLILLDSRTISTSVMYDAGIKAGAKAYRNSCFIDDHLSRLYSFSGVAIGHIQNTDTVNRYHSFAKRHDISRISQLT